MMRNFGIDILRGIAAFFIVGCHLQLLDYTPASKALLYFCDMNVGVFAALSGYLMAGSANRISRVADVRAYVSKRFRRLAPPYIAWSVVFLLASVIFQYFVGGGIKHKYAQLQFWMLVVFWGGAATHLWFIAALFYAQSLMCGALRRLPRGLWLLASALLIVVSVRWQSWYAMYPIRLLSFLLLGYCLQPCELKKRTGIFAVIMVSALAISAFANLPRFVGDWIAVGPILLFFASLTLAPSRVSAFIGQTSMGVFLVHPLLTVAFATLIKRTLPSPYGVSETMFVWVGAWVCSLAFSLVLLRIGRLKYIIT